MKVKSSITAKLIRVSIGAVVPACILFMVMFLQIGDSNKIVNFGGERFGIGGFFVAPILLYVIFWLFLFTYRSFKYPIFIKWIDQELVVGFRTKKDERIVLADIQRVRHWEPTKPEQVLEFYVDGNIEFTIAIDEYEARKAVMKLKENQIDVEEVFSDQPRLTRWFDRNHEK